MTRFNVLTIRAALIIPCCLTLTFFLVHYWIKGITLWVLLFFIKDSVTVFQPAWSLSINLFILRLFCYQQAEIVSDGPLHFLLALHFDPLGFLCGFRRWFIAFSRWCLLRCFWSYLFCYTVGNQCPLHLIFIKAAYKCLSQAHHELLNLSFIVLLHWFFHFPNPMSSQ